MNERKFYLVDTGKEVSIGDTIKGGKKSKDTIIEITATITEETIPWLIDKGIIAETPPTDNKTPVNTDAILKEALERITEKLSYNSKHITAACYLSKIHDLYPAAVLNIVLRELALMFDEAYPNHISTCEELYTVSLLDGRIHKVYKAWIKSYKNFAAFRTMHDARLACKILRKWLKEMFSDK